LPDALPGLAATAARCNQGLAPGEDADVVDADKLTQANEKLSARVRELAAQVQQLQQQLETANATAGSQGSAGTVLV
jgi:cell division protein FtsB